MLLLLRIKATLQKVAVKDIPQAEGRVLALKSGDVDVIVDYYHGGSDYTPRNLLKSLKDDGFQVLKKEMPMTTALAFNYKQDLWNNVTLRQGINYAINKDDLVAIFDGWINPVKDGLFSPAAPFMKEAGVKEYPYDAVFVAAKSNIKNIEYVSSEPRFDSVVVEQKP